MPRTLLCIIPKFQNQFFCVKYGVFSSRTGFGFENVYNVVVDTQTKAPYWPIRTGCAKENRFFW